MPDPTRSSQASRGPFAGCATRPACPPPPSMRTPCWRTPWTRSAAPRTTAPIPTTVRPAIDDTVLYGCGYCPIATLPPLTGTWHCVTCRAQDAAVPMGRVQEVVDTSLFTCLIATGRTCRGRPTSRGPSPAPKLAPVRPYCAALPPSLSVLPAWTPLAPRRPPWRRNTAARPRR